MKSTGSAMGRMATRVCTLVAAAFLLSPLSSFAQEFARNDVIVKPFEVMGEADPEYAKVLWQQLARAIEDQSDFRVMTSGGAYYYLKGQVLSDGKRHIITLHLFKAKTDRQLWVGNYDYRRTTADTMATDVIDALYSLPQTDTWD